MTPEQQKFYDIKKTTDYKVVGEDSDYKVFVDDQKKEVVLQFEESDSREDWKHNFQFLPWPLKLDEKTVWTTRGYACAYQSAQDQPLEDFLYEATRHADYKLCIRGWSFGSAMAKIAARHLIARFCGLDPEYKIDELTTYGDVKCWLNPFYSSKKQCKRIREYTNSNDLVTWAELFYSRDTKNRVGPRFSICRAIHTEYNHTHYEEYDYSKWEE